jgi:hypothetical protein
MKRFLALTAFALAAGFAGADPRPFQLGVGGGFGYLGMTNDVESNFSGALYDQRASYSFWGGSAFVDISDFFTLSTGVWSGLGKANGTVDPINFKATPDNTLLLLDVSAVLKGPVTVGPFTLSPKIGLSDVFYLAGQLGGATPDADTKSSLSPFSFLVGADADYVFPNGVFLRLPVDFTIALNSKPKGSVYPGSYVASSGFGFSAGLTVGYKLLGHENDTRPAPAPAAAAPPQTAEPAPAAPAQAEDQPPAKKPRFAVGGGTTGTLMFISQTQTDPLVGSLRIDYIYGNVGVYGFADITDYVSVFVGLERGTGSVAGDVNGIPLSSGTNSLLYFDFGAEVKYPIAFSDTISVSPKVGIADSLAFGGTINGSTLSSADSKQLFSPLSLTLGADFNIEQANNLYIRVPFDVGLALNTKLSDGYYSSIGDTYKSSYTLVFHSGVVLGYRL